MITRSVGRRRLITAPRRTPTRRNPHARTPSARKVPRERLEQHIAQLEHMEREVEHESRGLGAQALAAALTDRDAELSGGVGMAMPNRPAVPTGCESVRS